MWIMTSYGILMPALRPADTIAEGDDRTLQVRSRRAKDLDILRVEFMPELGETIHTPEFDYNYRAYCTPQQFADAVARQIMEIDYLKFKPTTDRYKDHELHGALNSIWGTVCRLGTPYEALGGYGRYVASKYGTSLPLTKTSKRTKRQRRADRRRNNQDPQNYADLSLMLDEIDAEALETGWEYAQRRARRVGEVSQSGDLGNAMAVHSTD